MKINLYDILKHYPMNDMERLKEKKSSKTIIGEVLFQKKPTRMNRSFSLAPYNRMKNKRTSIS